MLLSQRAQPLEDDADVAGVRREVEDGVEIDAAGQLRVGAGELGEVEPLFD